MNCVFKERDWLVRSFVRWDAGERMVKDAGGVSSSVLMLVTFGDCLVLYRSDDDLVSDGTPLMSMEMLL
jgi:hypothetical protein